MADNHGHFELGQRPSPSKSSAPRVRLSCEACRQRKIKCDKLSPCTNCQRFDTVCVPVERARLPRGRTGRPAMDRALESEVDLRDRVARIEQLLGDMAHNSNNNPAADSPPRSAAEFYGMQGQAPGAALQMRNLDVGSQGSFSARGIVQSGETESHAGSSYWKDLQTQGSSSTLRNDLRGDSHAPSNSTGFDMFLAGMADQENVSSPEYFVKEPFSPSQAQRQLLHVYLEHVDPVVKILHRPSLCAFLLHGQPYLDYEPGHPAPMALACSVYYLATCILSEKQCIELFRMSKETMVSINQKETDAALQRADFITSNDLTVLQAFVLSLIAARIHDQSRRVWAMLGIAIRVAQALSLHIPNPPFPVRPFEQEMRRRVWQAIGGLDALLSLDHRAEPLMRTNWLQSNLPSNVNDSDISFDMEGPVQESEGFTDMTFPLITMKSLYNVRALNFSDFLEAIPNTLHLRQQTTVDFQLAASQLLKNSQPESVAFHWFSKKTAECLVAMMQLLTLRPLQRCPNFHPPRDRGDNILRLAVDVLRRIHELQTDPRATPWRLSDWSTSIWHSMAVAIAELCVCDDPSLMERYWPFVEEAYQRFHDLPDSHRGVVFNAIEKFMAQGRAHRDKLLGPNMPNSGPPVPNVASSHAPPFSQPNMPPSTSFMPIINQPAMAQNPAMTMPEPTSMVGPWPSVWETMDFAHPSIDNVRNASWVNYEGFIEDLYDGAGVMRTGQ